MILTTFGVTMGFLGTLMIYCAVTSQPAAEGVLASRILGTYSASMSAETKQRLYLILRTFSETIDFSTKALDGFTPIGEARDLHRGESPSSRQAIDPRTYERIYNDARDRPLNIESDLSLRVKLNSRPANSVKGFKATLMAITDQRASVELPAELLSEVLRLREQATRRARIILDSEKILSSYNLRDEKIYSALTPRIEEVVTHIDELDFFLNENVAALTGYLQASQNVVNTRALTRVNIPRRVQNFSQQIQIVTSNLMGPLSLTTNQEQLSAILHENPRLDQMVGTTMAPRVDQLELIFSDLVPGDSRHVLTRDSADPLPLDPATMWDNLDDALAMAIQAASVTTRIERSFIEGSYGPPPAKVRDSGDEKNLSDEPVVIGRENSFDVIRPRSSWITVGGTLKELSRLSRTLRAQKTDLTIVEAIYLFELEKFLRQFFGACFYKLPSDTACLPRLSTMNFLRTVLSFYRGALLHFWHQSFQPTEVDLTTMGSVTEAAQADVFAVPQ